MTIDTLMLDEITKSQNVDGSPELQLLMRLQSQMLGDERETQIHTEEDPYMTDEFRMYSFKIHSCPRTDQHEHTECPFLHPQEKARRRDPRCYTYSCAPCPDFRKGSCKRNDTCPFSHGVFEAWLHPDKYRTQLCKEGISCSRTICFFAHTLNQLRDTSSSSISSSKRYSSSTLHGAQCKNDDDDEFDALSSLISPGSTLFQCCNASSSSTTSSSTSSSTTTPSVTPTGCASPLSPLHTMSSTRSMSDPSIQNNNTHHDITNNNTNTKAMNTMTMHSHSFDSGSSYYSLDSLPSPPNNIIDNTIDIEYSKEYNYNNNNQVSAVAAANALRTLQHRHAAAADAAEVLHRLKDLTMKRSDGESPVRIDAAAGTEKCTFENSCASSSLWAVDIPTAILGTGTAIGASTSYSTPAVCEQYAMNDMISTTAYMMALAHATPLHQQLQQQEQRQQASLSFSALSSLCCMPPLSPLML